MPVTDSDEPPADLSPVFLEERVAARADSLSVSERKAALYLAKHPEEVAFSSAAELGQLTGTSDATVIRTVKALGYDGLPSLKRALHENIRERIGPAGRLSRSLDVMGSEPETILAQVLATGIHLLEEVQRTIRPDSFAEAVELLDSAEETLVMGAGALGVLGEYYTLRMVRLRRRARTAVLSGYRLADDLLRLGPGDVLLLLVHGRVIGEVDVALDHAAQVGAKVVLITDSLGEALADRVHATVTEPVDNSETFTLQTTTLAVLDALALAIAAKDSKSSLEAMSEMKQIRDRLWTAPQKESQSRRRSPRRRTATGESPKS
jgi:DNA-binding MurR/RpiR family transcriptional regulator